MHILFDHNRLDHGAPESTVCEACRFYVNGDGQAGVGVNVTLSNSHLGTGCADGVYTDAGQGMVIGPGNEFEDFDQSACTYHVDPMSGFTSVGQIVVGNYMHNNYDGSGSLLSDREPGLVFKNNVVIGAQFYSINVKGPDTNVYTHNYFEHYVRMDQISNEGTWGGNNIVRNNVIGSSCVTTDPNISGDYDTNVNIDGGGTGCDITGPPILVSSPASGYYHYVLASNSPGYHAGTDGKSLGICDTCG